MPKVQVPDQAFSGFRQFSGGGFSFTMVPNQFLDEIVPIEKPCVVKVVCLVLRRTLGWIDQTGQRRQQNQVAYSEFAREMNMSTQAVADGLKIAIEKGYIVRVKAGTMRDAISGNPEAASYGLRWMSPLQAAPAPRAFPENEIPSVFETPKEEVQTTDSENQTVSSSLIIRDMINKADSEKTNKVELKPSSKFSESQKRRKFSSYIGNLTSDIGEQFGDGEHRLSNIKQALNCWEKSRLDEKEFARLLYQARNLTRQNTNALKNPTLPETPVSSQKNSWVTLAGEPSRAEISRPGKDALTLPRNRMPYFFKVLQDLIGRPATEILPDKPVETSETSKFPVANQSDLSLHNKLTSISNKPEGEEESFIRQTQQVEVQVFLKPVEKIEKVIEETAPVEAQVELSAELVRLAANFTGDVDTILAAWKGWQASLENPRLKALARRLIFLEKSQVRAELQSRIFPPSNLSKQEPSKEILLVFRNGFDSRYATSFIDDIAISLEGALQTKLQLYITHG